MKVKLLKKVRDRYKIVRVTKVSSSTQMWNDFYRECEKDLGLPFFALKDSQDSWRTRCYTDQDKAYDMLLKWINNDYKHRIKKDRTKEEVVWYPKSNK